MNNFMDDYFSSSFAQGVQNFIIALIVLLIGWLIAKAIGNIVEKAMKKVDLDNKVFNKFSQDDKPVNSHTIIGKTIYYILLIFVFIMFFNILNLDMIATPLSQLIDTFLAFIPAVLKAGLILLLAWVIASAVKWLIVTLADKLNLTHLFFKLKIKKTEEEIKSYIAKFAQIIFYLIILLFIPGVMNALSIQGVAEPFSGLIATMLAFVPKLLAAALIFAIGWFIARIIKNIVASLLEAVGSENLVSRLKLQKVFEGTSLAQFVGNLLFILIMIPVTISALEKLDLTGISEPAISMLNDIMNMVPNILIGIALILVGVWLGKFIGDFVRDYLEKLGFNRLVSKMEMNQEKAVTMTPAAIVGYVVQVLIIFLLVVQALTLVKLDFLVNIATAITAYLPSVLAAVLIVGIALILANIVQKVLKNILVGQAAGLLAGLAKYAILVIATFMALTQLGIATSIVTTAFTLILGGLALAFGLAFGLGGKEFAQKYLQKFDHTIEKTNVQAKNQDQDSTNDDNQF